MKRTSMAIAISMGFILYKERCYDNVHFLTYDFSGWNIGAVLSSNPS
jgi:hypothetical protein